jgi:SAM-dependent methyltransferase
VKCRHCNEELTLPFLDLGSAPPSNAYLSETTLHAPETWFPLRLLVCQQCWLVQTDDSASRHELFTDDYAYFSSFSNSWLLHARAYVETISARFALGPESMVAEIAANDGYLLQYVKAAGLPCYGVEPTANTAAAARAKGIEVIERFFGVALADELVLQNKAVDLVAANNVLAHVPNINDFVAGFTTLLKPQGVATFEFPHLLRMIQHNQFDTAYHEHYSYLSLNAVERIFAANGLCIFDVEEYPTHGGSLRVFAQRRDTGAHVCVPAVAHMLEREVSAGLTTAASYAGFQTQSERVKNDFIAFLIDANRQGKSVAAYGAAAKGNTLMNFAGVRADLLSFVVDRNPAKIGTFMPGSRIPIVSEERLRRDKPNYIVILPWNLTAEVVAQLSYVREWGASFVTAIPRLEVLR